MDNPIITRSENLMKFFSEWPLQMIYDFYEAECDWLGEAYCGDIESTYKHEDGVDILSRYLKEYKDSFRFLLKECRCENLPNTKDETEIAEWLLSEEQPKYLHKIVTTLSKGFIFEWIIYHIPNNEKKEFIKSACLFIEEPAYDYDEWEYEFTKGKLTRIEMTEKYGFIRNAICYFYRRVVKSGCLRILFHALNSNGRLNLAKHAEFITKGLHKYDLSHEVQRYYDNLCKEFPSYHWNNSLTFVLDKKPTLDSDKYPKSEAEVVEKREIEKGEIVKHEEFFVKEFPPHLDICNVNKKLDRSKLLKLIKDICSKWKEPNDTEWRALWFYAYKFMDDIGLINLIKDEMTGEERKRPPYSRYVKLIIQYIHPSYDGKYNDNLRNYMKKEPILKKEDFKKLFEEFKEGVTDFIKNSHGSVR